MPSLGSAFVASVLARCLVDNEFLELMVRHPRGAFPESEISDDDVTALSSCDWKKVQAFRGFICKVKHNDLWDVLPHTRAFLARANLEFTVFRQYAPMYEQLRSRAHGSKDDKLVGLTEFLLNEFEDGFAADLTLLRSLVHHERLIWELQAAQSVGSGARGDSTLAADCMRDNRLLAVVPVKQGLMRVVRCDANPFEVISILEEGSVGANGIDVRPRWLCYWIPDDQLHVLELDDASAAMFAQIDGQSTVGAILEQLARVLGCADIDLSSGRQFFRDAFARGMLVPTSRARLER